MDQEQTNASNETQLPGSSVFQNLQDFFVNMSTKKKLLVFGGAFGVVLIVALVGGLIAASGNGPKETAVTKQKPTGTPSQNASRTSSNTLPSNGPTPMAKQTQDESLSGEPTSRPTLAAPKPLAKIPAYAAGVSPKATQPNPYKYHLFNENIDDPTVIVRLVQNGSEKDIGEASNSSPGDSVVFTNDLSTVIFIGSAVGEGELQKISFYSISLGKIVHQISVDDIKQAIPAITVGDNSYGALSRMVLSPDGKKLAFSYGFTQHVSQISPDTAILFLDLTNSRINLLEVRGLVNSWKDNNTIKYELNAPAPTLAEYPGYQYKPYDDNPKNVMLETPINKIVQNR